MSKEQNLEKKSLRVVCFCVVAFLLLLVSVVFSSYNIGRYNGQKALTPLLNEGGIFVDEYSDRMIVAKVQDDSLIFVSADDKGACLMNGEWLNLGIIERENIRSISIGLNISSIPPHEFDGFFPNLEFIYISGEVRLGDGCFANSPQLHTVIFDHDYNINKDAFPESVAFMLLEEFGRP